MTTNELEIRTDDDGHIEVHRASFEMPPPPFRTCDEDGTHHFSHVKKLALSGKQYIHAVNHHSEPTPPMLLGTAVHFLVLGPRPGKPVLRFSGDARRGKEWMAFAIEHSTAEILTAPEWDKAEQIANAVKADPVAQKRLDGARFEVPLVWEEDGIKCSTSGVDIVSNDGEELADLKTTTSTYPDAWKHQAFKMLYPQQMAWYRRGARANGMKASRGLYILGVETKPPYEVVELELTEGMIDFADRTVALWLEKLRVYKESNQWPGYAQSSVPLDVPKWLREDHEEEADD